MSVILLLHIFCTIYQCKPQQKKFARNGDEALQKQIALKIYCYQYQSYDYAWPISRLYSYITKMLFTEWMMDFLQN
jgi:hypothetical protein